MNSVDTWNPPGPGPWQQDQAHSPEPMSRVASELLPAPFARGFGETMAAYGVLLDAMAVAVVNGFRYMQPQPFDMPGPDGPPSHDHIVSEIGRRTALAAHAFEAQIWKDHLRQWDDELKPTAISRHRALNSVDLGDLDTAALIAHLRECGSHVSAMVYQHHRFNLSAMMPIGDFLLQASPWVGLAPPALFAVLAGASPVTGLASSELTEVIGAVKRNAAAEQLVRGDGEPAERIAALRAMLPEVAEYLANTEYRISEGLDVWAPTAGERPDMQLGKIAAALDVDPDAATRDAEEFAHQLRSGLSSDQRLAFDALLVEARRMYRLRDERGIYSDVSALGLLRLAMLEAGRRLSASGRLHEANHVLDAGLDELCGVLDGSATPTADELAQRGVVRVRRAAEGAPRFLGPPPPAPPPVDMLPPPLARLMSAVGFMIEGVLGELPEPLGDNAIIIGIPAGTGIYEGRARLVHDLEDLFLLEQGEVLVTPSTCEAFNAMIHLVGAIVTDHGSYASHAAIMARELGFPAVVGTVTGSRRIRDGAQLRVDSTTGEVTVLG